MTSVSRERTAPDWRSVGAGPSVPPLLRLLRRRARRNHQIKRLVPPRKAIENHLQWIHGRFATRIEQDAVAAGRRDQKNHPLFSPQQMDVQPTIGLALPPGCARPQRQDQQPGQHGAAGELRTPRFGHKAGLALLLPQQPPQKSQSRRPDSTARPASAQKR